MGKRSSRRRKQGTKEEVAGATLDGGALIAFERGSRAMFVLLDEARADRLQFALPAGALAQVWRDGSRQVALTRLLSSIFLEVVPLTAEGARAAGELCAARNSSDVIDASVALCAKERGHYVITSDPGDIARLAPELRIMKV